MDLVESGINRQNFLKGRGAEVFRKLIQLSARSISMDSTFLRCVIVQTFDEGLIRNDKLECQAFLLINFKEILLDEICPRWM